MKKINQEELDMLVSNHNLYLDSVMNETREGEKLILDEIDFTENDLSKLDFSGVFITSSLFSNMTFLNTSFVRAELYSCIFKNVVFESVNFGKVVLDYAKIKDSEFLNSRVLALDTIETIFENVKFEKCEINGAFSNCYLKNIEINNSTIETPDFWRSIVNDIKISRDSNIKIEELIKELNVGTLENEKIIKGKEAIDYFIENFIFI